MRCLTVQVVVDTPLKQRLETLAKSHGRSVSSYIRVLINRHILELDRQLLSLQDTYQ